MKSEREIREAMVGVLKAQIEAVETDDDFQYIYNNAKQGAYADILQLNVYGRNLVKKNSKE